MRTRFIGPICLALVALTNLQAGLTYTAITRGTGAGAAMQSSTMRASIEGAKARMEVTELKETNLPDSLFLLPKDYTLKPMTIPQMPSQAGRPRPGTPPGANPFLQRRPGHGTQPTAP